jgi:hypothetical protein
MVFGFFFAERFQKQPTYSFLTEMTMRSCYFISWKIGVVLKCFQFKIKN